MPEISSRHRSLFSPRHCPSLNFPGSSQLIFGRDKRVQDAKLMTEAEIHAEANKCHNLRNRPCVSQWLIQSHDKQDASRLHAVGNMVLPKCAALAFHLMAAADREDAD